MLELLQSWLTSLGFSEEMAFYAARLVGAIAVLILSVLVDFVARRYIVSTLNFLVSKSRTKWDDAVVRAVNPAHQALCAIFGNPFSHYGAPVTGAVVNAGAGGHYLSAGINLAPGAQFFFLKKSVSLDHPLITSS